MMIVSDDRARLDRDPFEAAARDGHGCLGFLLHAPTREGHTVGELARGAPIAHLSWRVLRTLGIAMQPVAGSPLAAVAVAHPALSRIFADGPWCGAWASALLTLPGSLRGERMLFGRCYSAAVLLPRAHLAGLP